ncbi:hypothetical protein JCM33374_g1934 [Metschnikowia sp. JCM 33374]|nr:hypothetical protein JCM33374_g1934 [Metschnikowia sp. JCM 33374]
MLAGCPPTQMSSKGISAEFHIFKELHPCRAHESVEALNEMSLGDILKSTCEHGPTGETRAYSPPFSMGLIKICQCVSGRDPFCMKNLVVDFQGFFVARQTGIHVVTLAADEDSVVYFGAENPSSPRSASERLFCSDSIRALVAETPLLVSTGEYMESCEIYLVEGVFYPVRVLFLRIPSMGDIFVKVKTPDGTISVIEDDVHQARFRNGVGAYVPETRWATTILERLVNS